MERNEEPDVHVDQLARAALTAAVEVHRQLGPGYVESVYDEALALELKLSNIAFARQVSVPVSYKGSPVGQGRLDFLVSDALVLELKAIETVLPVHKAQLLSYLKMTGHRLGLLINFNVRVLLRGVHRVVLRKS